MDPKQTPEWQAFVAAAAAKWRHIENEGKYTERGYLRSQPCADPDEHFQLGKAEGDAWLQYRKIEKDAVVAQLA